MKKSARMKLRPPCGYMGGKRRVSDEIAAQVLAAQPSAFFDLCAGSGAVALSVIEAGYPPAQVTMVEGGPWGWFWRDVGQGTLDVDLIERMLTIEIPSDPKLVADWLQTDVALQPPSAATFLVLQSGSFGAVPCWWDGQRWRQANPEHNRGYNPRKYWEPSGKSKETKPRGTIFNPHKIVKQVSEIAERCRGLRGIHGCVNALDYSREPSGTTYFIDPPYEGDSGYGVALDVATFIASGPRPLWVMEGREIPGASHAQLLGMRRGHNVNRNTARKPDYLNVFG